MATTYPAATVGRPPLWPVIIAPVVAGLYYHVLKSAFAQSIISVLSKTTLTDIDVLGLGDPLWGTHWIYRLIAEVASMAFGAFVAAGLARGREFAAGITGACAISLGYIAKLGFLFAFWDNLVIVEPWYQYVIDGLMIVAAPLIAVLVAESAQQVNRHEPRGFGGINRLHLLWLWIAAFWYALGLITPMSRLYTSEPNAISMFVTLFVNLIPAASIAIPGYYGLALLSGTYGQRMHPVGRNLSGVLVLILGLAVGGVIQFTWYYGLQSAWTSLFG
jgi:hypothetical protein